MTATTVNALWKSESAPRCRLRSIHCVCCLSEAVHSEVNLIIHVSRYSLSSIPSWRDPSAHGIWPASSSCMERGRSRGSEPHLAQGWEIFVFMRMDRDAPRLSLLSLGKTVTPQSRDGKKKSSAYFRQGEDEKHTAVIARRWYWQLCGEYCTLTASGPGKPAINWLGSVKITGRGEEARGLRFQRGRSTTRVNSPSLKTHGKTKLHIPMSAVKEKKEGKMGDLNVLGGNWD